MQQNCPQNTHSFMRNPNANKTLLKMEVSCTCATRGNLEMLKTSRKKDT